MMSVGMATLVEIKNLTQEVNGKGRLYTGNLCIYILSTVYQRSKHLLSLCPRIGISIAWIFLWRLIPFDKGKHLRFTSIEGDQFILMAFI